MAAKLLLLALCLSVFALSGCSSSAKEYEVSMADFKFEPASLTVPAGEHVHFHNSGSATHTATSDTGAFDTGNLAGGGTDEIHFETAGTYAYHCKIHPAMKGTIVVT